MRYYSDKLGKFFNEEAILKAEEKRFDDQTTKQKAEKEALSVEKKTRANEVNEAYKAVKEAEKKFYELRNNFVKDYGYFHMSYTDSNATPITNFLDWFFEF